MFKCHNKTICITNALKYNQSANKDAIISKYLCFKTICVNAKKLILYDEISIFTFTKILLKADT